MSKRNARADGVADHGIDASPFRAARSITRATSSWTEHRSGCRSNSRFRFAHQLIQLLLSASRGGSGSRARNFSTQPFPMPVAPPVTTATFRSLFVMPLKHADALAPVCASVCACCIRPQYITSPPLISMIGPSNGSSDWHKADGRTMSPGTPILPAEYPVRRHLVDRHPSVCSCSQIRATRR